MRRIRKLFTSAILVVFLTIPSSASAIDPLTVAAVAGGLSKVLSLFDSGADPNAVRVYQNHQMLKLMHERLGDLNGSIERVYEKINEIPQVVRHELKYARNAEYRDQLLGYVERLDIIFGLLSAGVRPDLLSPQNRLSDLEGYTDRVRTSREDFNLPHMLLGMQIEKAIYYGFDQEHIWEGVKGNGAPGIKSIYLSRIGEMLDPSRKESLVSSRINIVNGIEKQKRYLETELESIRDIKYVLNRNIVYESRDPCGDVVEWSPMDVSATTHNIQKRLKKEISQHEIVIFLQIRDVYQSLISHAEYALAVLQEIPVEERPTRTEPRILDGNWVKLPELEGIYDRAVKFHKHLMSTSPNSGFVYAFPYICRDGRRVLWKEP